MKTVTASSSGRWLGKYWYAVVREIPARSAASSTLGVEPPARCGGSAQEHSGHNTGDTETRSTFVELKEPSAAAGDDVLGPRG